MDAAMNGYGLVAVIIESIAALAWPAAVFGVFFILRREIAAILPRLRVKHGDTEISIRRVDQLYEQAEEHLVRTISAELSEHSPLPATATSNLQALSDDEIRMRVEDVALRMRELEHRFRAERNDYFPTETKNWSDRVSQLSAQSDRQRHEWQTTLLPDAVALRDEMIRRIGDRREVDTHGTDFVFEGMLAGPQPLNEAALTLERLARNLTGPRNPSLATVV